MTAAGPLDRYLPFAGAAFLVIAVSTLILVGEGPTAGDSDATVVAWYGEHAATIGLAAFLTSAAAALLLVFGAVLRDSLRAVDKGPLPTVVLAGASVAAVGMVAAATVALAAASAADDGLESATVTLDQLHAAGWLPVAAGLGTMYLACVASAIRRVSRPLGGATVLLGVAAFTPAGYLTWLAAPLWVVATSVALRPSSDGLSAAASAARRPGGSPRR
jgi:hypothetical protein